MDVGADRRRADRARDRGLAWLAWLAWCAGRVGLVTAVLLVATACTPKAPDRSYRGMKYVVDGTRPEVVRADMREAAERLASLVERAADEIIETSDDPTVRTNALVWKTNVIAEGLEAAFRFEPGAAVLDFWVLIVQLRIFLTDGPGADVFGAEQAIAVRAVTTLETELEEMIAGFTRPGSVEEMRQTTIMPWVEQHPLRSLIIARRSIIELYTQVAESNYDPIASVTTIEELSRDVSRRLNTYAHYLPKQAVWQLELAERRLLETNQATEATHGLGELGSAAQRAADVAEELPDLIEREREAAVAAIGEERKEIIESVRDERRAVLDAIRDERVAVTDVIRGERVAVMEDVERQRLDTLERLTDERVIILDVVREERAAVVTGLAQQIDEAVGRVDGITGEALDASEIRLEAVVDHLFWRLVQLGVVVVVLFPFVARLYRVVLPPVR